MPDPRPDTPDPRNRLEGAQDQGGKQGGQAGMPKPTPRPGSSEAEITATSSPDQARRGSATSKPQGR